MNFAPKKLVTQLEYTEFSFGPLRKQYKMIAGKDKVVTLLYQLRKDSKAGDLIEETPKEKPFVFLFGIGQLLPEFEQNLNGLKSGDNFSFGITSENGYGNVNPEAIVDLDKNIFVIDGKLAEDLLVVDKVITMRNEEGQPMNARIVEVKEEHVKVDFNHPMAGINLHFTGEVMEVREATAEELDHGHVHGPGGHHH